MHAQRAYIYIANIVKPSVTVVKRGGTLFRLRRVKMRAALLG